MKGSKDYCFMNNVMDIIPSNLNLKANEHFLYLRIGTNEANPNDFVYTKSI